MPVHLFMHPVFRQGSTAPVAINPSLNLPCLPCAEIFRREDWRGQALQHIYTHLRTRLETREVGRGCLGLLGQPAVLFELLTNHQVNSAPRLLVCVFR